MLKLSDGMFLYHGGEVGSRDANTVLRDFIASKTGALLYDEESKLWWMGPSYIADMYKKEVCGE